MQAPGNHQVKHQPEIAFHANGDALANSSQFLNRATFHIGKRWSNGAENKRARDPYALQHLINDPRFKRIDVSKDVRQLWHIVSACPSPQTFATLGAGSDSPVGVSILNEPSLISVDPAALGRVFLHFIEILRSFRQN